MSHHIYKTEAIILESFNIGESNRFVCLLTKELGLIVASAQGVRELKSKLRFSLQNFSYSVIDLVRGREIWRVTNAKNIRDMLPYSQDIEKRTIFLNIISLTKRLFTGEVKHVELFGEIISGLALLNDEVFTKEQLRNFEVMMALKILNGLGYLSSEPTYAPFLELNNWNKNILEKINPVSIYAIKDINDALKETQM